MKKALMAILVLLFSVSSFGADHTKNVKHKHKKNYIKVEDQAADEDSDDKNDTHGASANFVLW